MIQGLASPPAKANPPPARGLPSLGGWGTRPDTLDIYDITGGKI